MLKLYSYWRSSASYRVRLALHLKGMAFETVPVHLVREGGEQHQAAYRALNPQGRLPLLVDGDFRLSQSLAIFRYLETLSPAPPLQPADARAQARQWQFCEALNADIQPFHNLATLGYLQRELGVDAAAQLGWIRHWIETGLKALEAQFAAEISVRAPRAGLFADAPGWAECCLAPQLYAARRFGADLSPSAGLVALDAELASHPAFIAAHPDQQPDAVR